MADGSFPGDVREAPWRVLVGRLAAGDTAALGDLYDATSRPVYALVLRILGQPADAEEVTLDVYSQAWKSAARYDPERGGVMAWLLTLARSRAIDRLRARGSGAGREALDLASSLPDTAPAPDESTWIGERRRYVRRALVSLPVEQREVIELAYFEGLTHTEIAERIGVPLGTAKSRIRLAIGRLRESLSPLHGGVA